MAGAGWREWTAGEQLTDAKMQTFLQDQSVMRFADANERTTALNGVVSEGMITYLDDLNVVEVYDGTGWTELTGDPDIFTQGTAGQYLASLGTAGVEWANIDEALPTIAGLHYGRPGQKSAISSMADSSYSVALGYNSSAATARPNASFIGNTTIGANTGFSITTGHNNVMVGGEAGLNVTTGARNVIVGASAAQQLSIGQINTIVGAGAGFSLTFGNGNVAVGTDALKSATDRGSNTAVGYAALENTNGLANTGIGIAAGQGITTGTFNTCIGVEAGSAFGGNQIGTGSANVLIGKLARPSANNVSNEITLGDSAITSLRCQVTSITSLSDERDKDNITDLPYGLDFVKELKPVSFDWNMRDGGKVGVPDIGFIAQDLAALEDQHDAERLALTLRNNPDKLEASPGRLIPILVKAIQELSARVEELENAR